MPEPSIPLTSDQLRVLHSVKGWEYDGRDALSWDSEEVVQQCAILSPVPDYLIQAELSEYEIDVHKEIHRLTLSGLLRNATPADHTGRRRLPDDRIVGVSLSRQKSGERLVGEVLTVSVGTDVVFESWRRVSDAEPFGLQPFGSKYVSLTETGLATCGPVKPTDPPAAVILARPNDPVRVRGKDKPRLTLPRYHVVKALVEAGADGLTKDQLVRRSGHTDAVNILKRLTKKDSDWQAAIQLAGEPGGRYRISG